MGDEDDMEIVGDSDFGTDMEGVMDDGGIGTQEATPELDYPMDGDMSDVEEMLEYEEDEAKGPKEGAQEDGDMEDVVGGQESGDLLDAVDEAASAVGEEIAAADSADGAGAYSATPEYGGGLTESALAESASGASSNPIPTSVPNGPKQDDATAHAKSNEGLAHIHMHPGSPQQKKDKLPNQHNDHHEILLGLGQVAQEGHDAVGRNQQQEDVLAEGGPAQEAQDQDSVPPGTQLRPGMEDVPSGGPVGHEGTSVPHADAGDALGQPIQPARPSATAQAAHLDAAGADGAGDGVHAAGGADGVRGVDHGPAADGGDAATHAGAGAGAGQGRDAAAQGVPLGAADVPAGVHDGGAAAGAPDAVHAAGHDAAAGGPGQAAADSVAHEPAAAAVHGAHESDAREADGAPDAAAGQDDGARDHVPVPGLDAGLEPRAPQDAAGVRGPADSRHERAAAQDGGLAGAAGGEDDEFTAELEDLEDATAAPSSVAASAADGGPGALAAGVTAEELPLDEAASEALQGHEDAAAAELADNTAEYYDNSLVVDMSLPVRVHFAETGKTYHVCGSEETFPRLFEDLEGPEVLQSTMESVFSYMRRALEGFCSVDKELVLSFGPLGLQLGEDNVTCQDVYLMDLVRLFQVFAANTVDYERPATFDLQLSLSQRFITNYNRLYSLAEEGHSLADLSDLSRQHVQQGLQQKEEVAAGGNLGKQILGSNSAALEDEAQVAEETARAQEASLEFAKQAFSGAKPSEDPEDELEPVLETNYLPLKRGPDGDGEGDGEGSGVKKAKEE